MNSVTVPGVRVLAVWRGWLTEVPPAGGTPRDPEVAMERHALSVTAENHPGVLTKVCGLFATRDANIQYLAAAPTLQKGVSHMTIVVRANEQFDVEDLITHVEQLPHVVAVEAISDVEAVATELQATADRAPRTVGSLTQRAF